MDFSFQVQLRLVQAPEKEHFKLWIFQSIILPFTGHCLSKQSYLVFDDFKLSSFQIPHVVVLVSASFLSAKVFCFFLNEAQRDFFLPPVCFGTILSSGDSIIITGRLRYLDCQKPALWSSETVQRLYSQFHVDYSGFIQPAAPRRAIWILTVIWLELSREMLLTRWAWKKPWLGNGKCVCVSVGLFVFLLLFLKHSAKNISGLKLLPNYS